MKKFLIKIFNFIKKIPTYICMTLIYFYKGVISPMFPRCCRYTPSCSQYSLEAIKKFGAIKGIILTIKRLKRCHPFGGKGWDPVPESFSYKQTFKKLNN